jgi:hypothetical protein
VPEGSIARPIRCVAFSFRHPKLNTRGIAPAASINVCCPQAEPPCHFVAIGQQVTALRLHLKRFVASRRNRSWTGAFGMAIDPAPYAGAFDPFNFQGHYP